ncbi:hypothetical protein PK28_07875 [Hymenobacter sp. DG25B]|uniref:acyltransferase family protein n=1 Tax=Hymenobacter sp. DG25B TaxID=1385664 RepID=UPI0005410A97|nr:acyltransferase [Hymenobacter sp. DG25B]AIZ63628.1 hypothetical protein PK28_07875 [Hymenobacter sp. DG25B]
MLPRHKINSLRGVAILLVFGYHSLLVIFGEYEFRRLGPSHFFVDLDSYLPGQIVLNLLPTGMGAGVTIFLVLSGFLIHWNHLKNGEVFQFSSFINRRFWRIYPPYLAALLFFSLSRGTEGGLSLLTHLTLTHNLLERTFFSINPALWSLGLEVQLYLLYPVLLWLRRHLGMSQTTLAIGLLGLATMGTGLLLHARSPVVYLSPPAMWILWAIGAFFGEQYFQQKRLFSGHGLHLLAAFFLLTLLKITVLYLFLGRLLFALFFVCLLDWFLQRNNASIGAGMTLFGRVLSSIGLCSYSIYLFHQPYLHSLIGFFSFYNSSKPALGLGVLLSFGLVFVVAQITYRLLELPSLRLGKVFYQRFWPSRSFTLGTFPVTKQS